SKGKIQQLGARAAQAGRRGQSWAPGQRGQSRAPGQHGQSRAARAEQGARTAQAESKSGYQSKGKIQQLGARAAQAGRRGQSWAPG
ncbi:hypothetical protein, partial [Klebsiella aerogenes]|uniref:hypothetical protein n=1 Tax=Klebsiella aerogenes TaxID=548 RepID=UPI001CC7E9FC